MFANLTIFILNEIIFLLFQGIWKIPIDEIDRSGSFPSHLNKCITLLLDVLKRQKDPGTLFQIHVHLNRQPEAGK